MKHKLLLAILSVIAIIGLVGGMALAGDGKSDKEPKIGTKVVLDTNTETVYLGKNDNGESVYTATITGLPKHLPDKTTVIDPSWHFDSQHNEWVAGANLFEATVDGYGTKVTINNGREKMTLDPDIKIAGKTVKPLSKVPMIVPDYYDSAYTNNTLQWDYGLFRRQIRIIEGWIMQYLIFDANPGGDVNIDSPKEKSIGYTWEQPVAAWSVHGKALKVADNLIYASEFDKATYPVIIDPTSTFYYGAGYSGWVESYQDTWASVHNDTTAEYYQNGATEATVGCYGNPSYPDEYYIDRAFVAFDTSSLPDGITISAATVSLYGAYDADSTVSIQLGLQSSSITASSYNDFSGSYYATEAWGSGYQDMELNATGINAINKTGITKYCIREYTKDYSNSAPNGDYWNTFYLNQSGTSYDAKLEVTYATLAPTGTTDAASNISYTSARLNATIVDDGGEACEVRWGYDKTGSRAAITDYDDYTAYAGSYTTGQHPYLDISGLDSNTTYYFAVEIQNSEDSDLGAELTFDTLNSIADVDNLRAYSSGGDITLSWTKPAGATNTMVRYALDDFPPTTADGEEIYLDTGNNYTQEGVTAGITYYYSAWGESGGNYSTNPDTTLITTLPAGYGGSDLEGASQPTGWYQAPNYTNLSNLGFFYDAVNNMADDISMPRATAWLLLVMTLACAAGLLLYWRTRNQFAALGGSGVIVVFGYFQEIAPLWMLIALIIAAVGIMVTKRSAVE